VDHEAIDADEDGDEMLLLLRTVGDRPLTEAMAAAKAAMDSANRQTPPGGVEGQRIWPSPDGPVLQIGYLPEKPTSWLAIYVRELELGGWSGHLELDTHDMPLGGLVYRRTFLTAFRAGEVVPFKPAGSHVVRWVREPERLQWEPRELVDWLNTDGRELYIWLGLSSRRVADGFTLARWLRWGAEHHEPCAAWATLGDSAEQVGLVEHGLTTFQSQRESTRAALDRLIEGLTIDPAGTDLAMVVDGVASSPSTDSLDTGRTSPPFVDVGQLSAHRDLWNQYTFDAYGVQVLTDAHLDKANDLNAWRIDELTPGRYLVQAPDLEPWYRGSTPPDPDVVARARADFEGMILTPEILTRLGRD
jgi:hypothetical protein